MRLAVPDMTCSHCEQAIEGALLRLDGVDGVTVDIAGKVVDVEHDGRAVSAGWIAQAVEQQGYTVPATTRHEETQHEHART
ncbi:MAG: cation transporter [Solirubrobacteraceae bacterium]